MTIPHSPGSPAHDAARAGGAYVRRRLDDHAPGAVLTAEQVRAIPAANLQALINTGRLELFPAAPVQPGERFIRALGQGRFDVIEGRRLTDRPVTR